MYDKLLLFVRLTFYVLRSTIDLIISNSKNGKNEARPAEKRFALTRAFVLHMQSSVVQFFFHSLPQIPFSHFIIDTAFCAS